MTHLGVVQSGARYLSDVVMLILGAAGILKLVDLAQFSESLQSWILVPGVLRALAVIFVPIVEVLLCILWFGRVRRQLVAIGAVGMLVLFSLVYAAHLVLVGPPECRCFGLMHKFLETRDLGSMVIWRNVALVAGLLPFLIVRSDDRGEH